MDNGRIRIVNSTEGRRIEKRTGQITLFLELTLEDWDDLNYFFSNQLLTSWNDNYYQVNGQGD